MKNIFLQEVRGICIILVIMIHLPTGDLGSSAFAYWLSFRQVINIPVAIFIFLAGYFINTKNLNSDNAFETVKSKIKRILFPYIIWSGFYIFLRFMGGGGGTEDLTLMNIGIMLLTGSAVTPLYFLVVLLQLIILSPFIVKIINSNNRLIKWSLWSITPLWLLFRYYYSFTFLEELPLNHVIFPAWFIFYYFGLMTQKKSKSNHEGLEKSNILSLVFLLLMSLLLSLFESNILFKYTGLEGFASSQIKFSSFLYAFLFIKILLMLKNVDKKPSFLSKVGDYSFGIYLLHIFVLMVVVKIFEMINFNLPFYFFFLEQLITLLLVLFITYYSILLIEKVLNPRLTKLIGFN